MASTGQRLGGTLQLSVDGSQYPARGSFEVSKSTIKRDGVSGVDGVHGYTETPTVPSIRGEITALPTLSLSDLENVTDSTVQITLANGKTYTLKNAWVNAAFVINAAEGKFNVEFMGLDITES